MGLGGWEHLTFYKGVIRVKLLYYGGGFVQMTW
jgi:hypothetical protein